MNKIKTYVTSPVVTFPLSWILLTAIFYFYGVDFPVVSALVTIIVGAVVVGFLLYLLGIQDEEDER